VITTLAGNTRTPLEFFQFIGKSMVDADANAENRAKEATGPEGEGSNPNEVYLSTIHRAKGKEFRNVVYFNLSQTAADPHAANSQRATFIEEERRVTYVGATRPKDDLLITFASTRPSEFLWEIALNPRYREVEEEDLQRALTSAGLHLERARVVLNELEAKKQDEIRSFHELTRIEFAQLPAWLRWLLHKIHLWRIDRALAGIEVIEAQIKTHQEGTIAPLEWEIHALQEEEMMRAALLGES
jgi:hypothetical protein